MRRCSNDRVRMLSEGKSSLCSDVGDLVNWVFEASVDRTLHVMCSW